MSHDVLASIQHCVVRSCSSIQLLGDLLYKVSGLSGKMSTVSEEDDNFGTEEARLAIIRSLGEERRNRVLAGLYMGRWVLHLVSMATNVMATNVGAVLPKRCYRPSQI